MNNNFHVGKLPWYARTAWGAFSGWFLTLFVPFVIMMEVLPPRIINMLEEDAINRNMAVSGIFASTVDEHFSGLKSYLHLMAARSNLRDCYLKNDTSCINDLLIAIVQDNRFLDRVFISDIKGNIIYDYPHDPKVTGQNFSSRDWYINVQNSDTPYVSEIYQRAANGKPFVIAVATKFKDVSGAVSGYIVIQQTVKNLFSWMAQINPAMRGNIFIVDHRNNLLSHEFIESRKPLLKITEFQDLNKAVQNNNNAVKIEDPFNKLASVVKINKVEKLGWTIILSQPLKSFLMPLNRVHSYMIMTGLIGFIIILLAGFYFILTLRGKLIKHVNSNHVKEPEHPMEVK